MDDNTNKKLQLLKQERTYNKLSNNPSSLEAAQVLPHHIVTIEPGFMVVDDDSSDHFVSKEEARMYIDSVMVKHGLQNDCQTNVLCNFFNSSTNLAYTSENIAQHNLESTPGRMQLFQEIEEEQKGYTAIINEVEDMMKLSSKLMVQSKLPVEKLIYRLAGYEYTLQTSDCIGDDLDDTAYATDQIRKDAAALIQSFTQLTQKIKESAARIEHLKQKVTEKQMVVNTRLSLIHSPVLKPITGFLRGNASANQNVLKSSARIRSWSDTCGVISSNEVSMLNCISEQLNKLEIASVAFMKLVGYSESVVRNFCKQVDKISLALSVDGVSTEVCDEALKSSQDTVQAMSDFVGFDVDWSHTSTSTSTSATKTSTSPTTKVTAYHAAP